MRRSFMVVVMLCALSTAAVAGADEPAADSVPAAPPPGAVAPSVPAPPSVVPTQPAAVPAPAPSAVQSVAPELAEAVLGLRVDDSSGNDIGRLVDVLVDANGQPHAGVIDFGGFMGVGNRKVAVHWSALHFNPADPKHKVTLDMTPDQIKDAPQFLDPSKAAPVVTPADSAPALAPVPPPALASPPVSATVSPPAPASPPVSATVSPPAPASPPASAPVPPPASAPASHPASTPVPPPASAPVSSPASP